MTNAANPAATLALNLAVDRLAEGNHKLTCTPTALYIRAPRGQYDRTAAQLACDALATIDPGSTWTILHHGNGAQIKAKVWLPTVAEAIEQFAKTLQG
jgi:hypothetical protein